MYVVSISIQVGESLMFITSLYSITVCKILVQELRSRLTESGKSKEVLRIGQGLDDSHKKAIKYDRS